MNCKTINYIELVGILSFYDVNKLDLKKSNFLVNSYGHIENCETCKCALKKEISDWVEHLEKDEYINLSANLTLLKNYHPKEYLQ